MRFSSIHSFEPFGPCMRQRGRGAMMHMPLFCRKHEHCGQWTLYVLIYNQLDGTNRACDRVW